MKKICRNGFFFVLTCCCACDIFFLFMDLVYCNEEYKFAVSYY